MKDLPPRPQPPHPLLSLPRELRLVQVGDGDLREAADGDRRHAARVRGVRRRLFVDEDPSREGGAADEQVAVLVTQPVQDTVEKLVSDETAAASQRWNFDFVNERPLEGQWQWEKVEGAAGIVSEDVAGQQKAQPVDEYHSPQR